MRFACLLLVAGCGAAPVEMPPDLGVADSCAPSLPDGGACATSNDCARATACFGGSCGPVAACVAGCAGGCSLGRVCDGRTCQPPSGALCAPCSVASDCAATSGAVCKNAYCATKCDDVKVFCPRGFSCDVAPGKTAGYCVPALAVGCAGCADDSDCPKGEVCNVNNRRCVPAPTGPDARLEIDAIDFLYQDMNDGGVVYTKSRNLSWTTGFYTRRDPSFDPLALDAGKCGAERSTFDLNAPFPIGPARDAGDPITLLLGGKMIPFALVKEDDPRLGFSYDGSLMVDFWVPGPASWTGAGGADVGAFSAVGVVPPDFTTTPDVLGQAPVMADATKGVTVTLDAPSPAGTRTVLEVSYNEGSGNVVTALTRIACRAPDGDAAVTIPGAMLANVPRGVELGLTVSRASVVEFQAKGIAEGRAIWATQKSGAVIVAP